MKIAQIAPLFESVPPHGYGGTERIVSYLTEALVAAGHDVTLYASGDSVTSARLVPVVEQALRPTQRSGEWPAWQTLLIDRVFADARDYDVLHFHLDYQHFPLVRRCGCRAVSTMHGRLDLPELRPLFRHFGEQPLVSISDSQRQPLPWANWRATVHHGLPADLYTFQPDPGDYFAFLGRISPEKRVDRAIAIARAVGTTLRIAAKVDDADRAYFESCIRPLLAQPLVEFIGEIDEARKNEFLGGARALLFPIDWPEPFGIVMIEAFACGTPVLGYAGGSVGEVMEDGVTGYVVADQQQAIAAAAEIGQLDRRRCREVFEARYTARTMAQRYLDVYRALGPASPSSTQERSR